MKEPFITGSRDGLVSHSYGMTTVSKNMGMQRYLNSMV